jgi:hypothetical protein
VADRTLVVRLVGDEQDLLRSYAKSERATKNFGKTTDQVATKSSKRLSGLAKVGGGLAAGFVAAEGLNQVRNAINAAAESEAVLTQTRQALESTGKSWERYGDQIDETVTAQSRLGFDDEALLGTFTNFQRQTEDVTEALKLNALAMDVARGRNIDLESAAKLVTKAAAGQKGALTRLGIEVDKNADKTDLLRILTEKYGGSAEAAAGDARTANERLAVSIENVQESIGTLLLPVVSDLATELAGAADSASVAIANLRDLGKVKIPVINVPLNFTVPGTDTKIGRIVARVFGETNPITGRTSPIGGLRTIRQAGDLFRDDPAAPANTRTPITSKSLPPIVIQNTIQIDGKTVALATRRYNEIDKRSNPSQKRGGNWRR